MDPFKEHMKEMLHPQQSQINGWLRIESSKRHDKIPHSPKEPAWKMRKGNFKTDCVILGTEDMLEEKGKGWGCSKKWGMRRKAKGTNIREYIPFVHHYNLLQKLKIKKKKTIERVEIYAWHLLKLQLKPVICSWRHLLKKLHSQYFTWPHRKYCHFCLLQ